MIDSIRRPVARAACGGALALSTACGLAGPDGTRGELGNGSFTYKCDSDSDVVCDDGAASHPVPQAVALGSRFSVTFAPPLGEGSATVEPASSGMLTETASFGSSFKALRPGTVALLARRGEVVLDFVHIGIAAIDHIQIDLGTPARPELEGVTSIEIEPGETVELRALPVDTADEPLAGALSCAWSVADDAIAKLSSLSSDNNVVLQAVSAGSTTALVKMDDVTAEVSVRVRADDGGGGAGGEGGGAAGGGGQ